MRVNTIIPRQTPLGPIPGPLRLRSLTRWAAEIGATCARPCPPRRERRNQPKLTRRHRGFEKLQTRLHRRLGRRFGRLSASNLDRFLAALDRARVARVLIHNAAITRLAGRKSLLARTAPRPRAAAIVVPRTAPTAPGEGPSAQGPPDQESSDEGEGDGDPPPPPVRPRQARGRGRPRKVRRFRAHPGARTYRARLGKLDAVAAALEGRGDALFATLTPLTPPDDKDRRLAAVPRGVAQSFARFAAKLRRAGATFALVVATRADSGAFWPHAHAIVAGVDQGKLGKWAAREALALHVEGLKNPRAAARYMARAGQKAAYDGILGGRGFYYHRPNPTPPPKAPADLAGEGASSRSLARPRPALPAPDAIPAGLELAPGVSVADPAVFVAALARDLEARARPVREAAQHHLTLLRAALAERSPP